VSESGSRRVGGADGSPTICAGIVSPAGVETVNAISGSAPDDHFAACPHCRGEHSAIGRVGDAGWSPRVVSAWGSAFRNIARTLGAEKGRGYPGRQQKQIKRAANKMRFGRGANFHLACASVRKLLLEARQRCRDFSCKKAHHSLKSPVCS
jgi:hypothetical protein